MEMKPDEIVVRYRQAKDKSEQLKILADLNACTVDGIINVLCEHGGYKPQYFNTAKAKIRKEKEPVPAEPEKIPPVVRRAISSGLTDLADEIDVRLNRIEELKCEIEEFQKDIDALNKWREEHE